jgi:Ni/Co efflux regulator RcnB
MILGFFQKINGRPTNFREKIRSCVTPIVHVGRIELPSQLSAQKPVSPRQLSILVDDVAVITEPRTVEVATTFKPKKHTIRHDKNHRWRVGMKIQMVYRGKHYSIADHFNKGISELEEVKSIQKITIKWRRPTYLAKQYGNALPPFTLRVKNQFLFVYIDDKLIGHKTLKELAINDGFESIAEFLQYFRKSIRNWRLINWTNHKY